MDQAQWPVKAAIAVPVEMLESWLLLICGHPPESLPLFARQKDAAAARFYAPQRVSNQLKDLCQLEMTQASIQSMADFCLECAVNRLEPDELAAQSLSFAAFKRQVEEWQ